MEITCENHQGFTWNGPIGIQLDALSSVALFGILVHHCRFRDAVSSITNRNGNVESYKVGLSCDRSGLKTWLTSSTGQHSVGGPFYQLHSRGIHSLPSSVSLRGETPLLCQLPHCSQQTSPMFSYQKIFSL